MAMVEVTNRCNMACPLCFSDANDPPSDVPLGEIRCRLERLLEVTKTPVPVQISGGEPTTREDLPAIVALAKRLGYRHVELVTNGIRIGEEPELLSELKCRGLKAVYLQFDGLKRETHLALRGQDLRGVRAKAIDATRRAGLCCTLAVAVARAINDAEIGDIVRFAIDNIDTVRAVNFQSATRFSGRYRLEGVNSGYSVPEMLGLIEAQTGVPATAFRSEHMGHPNCNTMALVFLVGDKLVSLFEYISRDDVLEFFGERGREKVLDLFDGKIDFFSRHLSNPAAWKLIAKASRIFGHNPLNVPKTKHIALFVKSFMERQQLDPERVNRCCYGISSGAGVFSFCAFNNLYRFSERPHRAAADVLYRAGEA
jgi:uncharacterized radical SAM superfamily Fe-S cluster-containing enzyme